MFETIIAPKERDLRKCSTLTREELAIEIIERVFAPKGLHDSARGFNPGNRPTGVPSVSEAA
jgi:hypothetical protein